MSTCVIRRITITSTCQNEAIQPRGIDITILYLSRQNPLSTNRMGVSYENSLFEVAVRPIRVSKSAARSCGCRRLWTTTCINGTTYRILLDCLIVEALEVYSWPLWDIFYCFYTLTSSFLLLLSASPGLLYYTSSAFLALGCSLSHFSPTRFSRFS